MAYIFDEYWELTDIVDIRLVPLVGQDYTYVAAYYQTYGDDILLKVAVLDFATKTVYTPLTLDSGTVGGNPAIVALTATEFCVHWIKGTNPWNFDGVAKIAKVSVSGTTVSQDGLTATYFGGEFMRSIMGTELVAHGANSVTIIFSTSYFFTLDIGLHLRAAVFAFGSWLFYPPTILSSYWESYYMQRVFPVAHIGGGDFLMGASVPTGGGTVFLVRNNFTSVSIIDSFDLPYFRGEFAGGIEWHRLGIIALDSTRFLVTWGERTGAGTTWLVSMIVEPGIGAMTIYDDLLMLVSIYGPLSGQLWPGALVRLNSGRYRMTFLNEVALGLQNIMLTDTGGEQIQVDRVDYGIGAGLGHTPVAIALPETEYQGVGAEDEISGVFNYRLIYQISEGLATFWAGPEGDIEEKSNLPGLQVEPGALAVNSQGLATVGFSEGDVAVAQASGNYSTWTNITNNHPNDGRITHLEWTEGGI